MTVDRSPWQIERDRLVAQIIHDATHLARAGHDLKHPDWWPSLHRIADNRRALIALAVSIGEADQHNTTEESE